MKKGFVSEIGWTTFLLIALMVMAFMGFIAVLAVGIMDSFSTSPGTIEFLAAENRPYIAANVLAYSMAGDRQFLENAVEILATGSRDGAGARGLTTYLRSVFSRYGNSRFISVSVIDKDSAKELYYVDNVPERCGSDLSGICLDKHRWGTLPYIRVPYLYYVGCSEGRRKISDELYAENKCKSLEEICCTEDPAKLGECGNGKGVCDWSGGCSEGRVEIQKSANECVGPRGRGTCCVPAEAETLENAGLTSRAEIPVLYSGKAGIVRVTMT